MQSSGQVVVADVQGADAHPGSLGWRPPQDHHLLPSAAFNLDPRRATATPIGSIFPFADDPLQLHLACFQPNGLRVASEMIAVSQHSRPIPQVGKQLLPVEQGARAQVPAIEVKKIKSIEDQRLIAACLQRAFETGKARHAVFSQADQFTVQHCGLDGERRNRTRDRRQARRPVMAVSCQQPD
jgi:hypothetical protein